MGQKVNPQGIVKKFEFNHIIKWYMHKPESVLGNETHKILCDFELQADPLIPDRRSNLMIAYKKKGNQQNSWLCRPGGPQSENQ